MFDDAFLDSLPVDPLKAISMMCREFRKMDTVISPQSERSEYDSYVTAFAALEAFVESTGLAYDSPQLSSNRAENITTIRKYFDGVSGDVNKIMTDRSLAEARDRFRTRFGIAFLYEFSDGDLNRIQSLINELRESIVPSELFDAKHKERILSKLEALQKELHKKVSSLDKFWGLIGDAGVVIGKFGVDAKPLVDRIKEIAQIVWRTQARAEELPSGTPFPLLSAPTRTDKEKE